VPLPVEVWKQVPHWNPGRRKFMVLSKDLPGPCDECAPWLGRRRWLAAAASVAPFLLLALAAGISGTPAGGVVAGLYGLYLVRAGSYGWLDAHLYGDELEAGAGALIPRFPDGSAGRVRFPGGLGHAAARLGSAAVLGFCLAFAGFAVHGADGGSGGSFADTLSLLSRPSTAYVVLGGEGNRFALTDVGGARAAVAYTSWEALPPGPAVQLSPHDAFERALEDPAAEAVVFDPGREQIVVGREDFLRMKLHLPLWPSPDKRLEKR
jgi:hypothetical protein